MQHTIGRITRLLLALACLAGTAGCDPTGDSGQTEISGSGEMLRRTLEHDTIEREYFVHVPPQAVNSPPLLVALHGYGSTATGFQKAYDLNAHADKHGYVVVYPQGSHFTVGDSSPEAFLVTSWNDLAANGEPRPEGPHCADNAVEYPCPPECGTCNQCDWTSCNDDLGLIERILDSVQTEFATDKDRTYLLGVSNGAMMALQLGCRLSDRFAAVAPIIGQLAPGYACGPESDTPMLHLYGQRDNTVRYDGKPGGDGYIYTTAADTAAIWANALECASEPLHWETESSAEIGLQCTVYTGCAVENQEVVSCMDPEGEHDWSGQRVAGMPATCVTAEQLGSMPNKPVCPPSPPGIKHPGMDLVWQFVSQYDLQSAK